MTDLHVQDRPEIHLLGLSVSIGEGEREKIPPLWEALTRAAPNIGDVALEGGYGLSLAPTREGAWFDYMAALPVVPGSPVPEGFEPFRLEAGRYAIFPHGGTTGDLARHCDEIFAVWVRSGRLNLRSGALHLVECYLPGFDHRKPGHIELWLPLA